MGKYSILLATLTTTIPALLKFLATLNPNVPSNSIIDWLLSLWPVKVTK
jgi:hypothetical protein